MELTGLYFLKVGRYNDWFMLNIIFACAIVDSEFGNENPAALLKWCGTLINYVVVFVYMTMDTFFLPSQQILIQSQALVQAVW